MAATLPVPGTTLANVPLGLPQQQRVVAEGTVCCFLPPSPGRQVGSASPAVSWGDGRCRAGLCVMSGEPLMPDGSCGVNNLRLSITWGL